MNQLFSDVAYLCSQTVTSNYSTSFSLAVKMLSPKIQKPIHAIYGFVRFADEIVDTFHETDQELLLNEFERDLNAALERKISLNPILHSFQEVYHKYNIDREMVDAFMHSMRLDLHQQNYNSMEDYNEYIYGSADVVGLMCLKVFVNGDQAIYNDLKDQAMSLGSAFQKVNFLRDLKQDSDELNRIYFPHLQGSGLNVETKKQIIEEIEGDFNIAYQGIKKLPIEAKFGVYTAFIYYQKLLHKLQKTNAEEIKTKRIRINNPTKIKLLVSSYVNYKLDLI